MVECEYVPDRSYSETSPVLIDTWWNVNHTSVTMISKVNIVLIDTWWNVNNRYFLTQVVNKKVLIDTWWNVNSIIIYHRRVCIAF